MDKFFQAADWHIRPLPEGMMDYARSDSHFLIPIYLSLMKQLNPLLFNKDNQASPDLYLSPELKESSQSSKNDWIKNIHQI